MSRLRSLDSKISFFAFADIITAVSGVLIFVALLLATDLGHPSEKQPPGVISQADRLLQETLATEAEIDDQNRRLQELLAAANTAPDTGKLQTDISGLRSQLAEEQKKQTTAASQLQGSQATIAARDKVLGLTDLKSKVQRLIQEVQAIEAQNDEAHKEMNQIQEQVEHTESQLLVLRQRDGQVWLIPDTSSTTKEPILVTVSGSGITVEFFDKPDKRKQFDKSNAAQDFKALLNTSKPLDEYVVFLVRPSGIETFQELVKTVRDLGFDVGYDALEEDRQIHFSTPPPLDQPVPTSNSQPSNSQPSNSLTSTNLASQANDGAPVSAQGSTNSQATTSNTNSSGTDKTWWQRIKEWMGLK